MDQKRPISCILEATTLSPVAGPPHLSIVVFIRCCLIPRAIQILPRFGFGLGGFRCCGKYPDEGNLMERRRIKRDPVGAEGPSSQSSRYHITLYSQSRSSHGMLAFHSGSPFYSVQGPSRPCLGWGLPFQFTHQRKKKPSQSCPKAFLVHTASH